MRARLLDMGQVGPLRAHGLRLALAEALGPEGEPALLVACAAAPSVTLGEDQDLLAQVDLEACAAHRVPVLRLPGEVPARFVAEGALWLTLLLPLEQAAGLDLPATGQGRQAWLAGLLAAAGEEGADTRAISVDEVAGCLALTACLGFGVDQGLEEILIRRLPAAESGGGEASGGSSPAEVAESLLQILEQRVGLELVPSMPMPRELDAVYEWERKLVAAAEREAASTAA